MALDLLDTRGRAQEAAQLVEGGADVVDGEHAHQPATTPGWKRGSRSTTRVPACGAVSTISP